MTNRLGTLALCLLAIGPCASAQVPEAPAQFPADRPSNGVLELSAAQAPDPSVRPDLFPPDNIWHGGVVVSLKNVSPFPIRLSEGMLTYEFTVLDSSGNPVPLKEKGKELLAAQQAAHSGHPPLFMGNVSSFDLRSGDTRTGSYRLSNTYEIQPGADYTIRVKYSWDMPKSDSAGQPITQRELTYTLKAKGGVMAH
jgi:hypothetical protein